jgi:nucleotide-sensitive chloride channel 1A
VEGIYMAMSDCAALHPDEESLDQEDYYGNDQDFYADPSDEAELNEMQQAALRHLESVFEPPMTNGHGQYEPAAEEDKK